MIQAGSQMKQFRGTHSSAWQIVSRFTGNSHPMQLQVEMVDEGKKLDQTTAARNLQTTAARNPSAWKTLRLVLRVVAFFKRSKHADKGKER
jgi:hypothetical protein